MPASEVTDVSEVLEPAGFLKQLSSILKRPENFNLLLALVLFIALLWLAPEVIEKSKTIRESLHGFFAGAFEPAATGELETWFVLATVFFVGLLFISSLYTVATVLLTHSLRIRHKEALRNGQMLQAKFLETSSSRDTLKGELSQLTSQLETLRQEKIQAREELAEQGVRLAAHFNETVQAVSKISRQLFPLTDPGKGKTIRTAHIAYHIHKNFDAEVLRRYVIRAGEMPIHFWQNSIDASAEAQQMGTFTDIGYQLLSRNPGRDVVYLPVENDGFHKSVCIFFLPLISPGEEREIEVVYRWPGLMRRLQKLGWEDFTYSFRSAGAIEEFDLEVFIEDGTGGHLSCTEIGVALPERILDAVKNDRGWRGWRYGGKNIPSTLLAEEIVARLEWTRS
jgi:hypothetical protein